MRLKSKTTSKIKLNIVKIKKWQQKSLLCLTVIFLSACMETNYKPDVIGPLSVLELSQLDVDSSVESDFNNAVTLLQQNKNEQAISVLERVLKREKRLPAPYVNIAIAYSRTGKLKLAEDNLQQALKINASDPIVNNELGIVYRKKGEFELAKNAYQQAIATQPNYLPAKKNLGVLCDIYMNDTTCALEQFENYLQKKPDDKSVKIWLADVKRRAGKNK